MIRLRLWTGAALCGLLASLWAPASALPLLPATSPSPELSLADRDDDDDDDDDAEEDDRPAQGDGQAPDVETEGDDAGPVDTLGGVRTPLPDNLGLFVTDRAAAIRLGKALFWDEQVGSDGRVACATCHFHAGADDRVVNTVHPGPNGIFETVSGPGQAVTADMFPITSDDVVGSSGMVSTLFNVIHPGLAVEDGTVAPDAVFGTQRVVTGRNSPTALNSTYFDLHFWDGRAANEFNGVTEGGDDDDQVVLVARGSGVAPYVLDVQDASAASQAVGPPTSAVEMSFLGRDFEDIAKKVLQLQPLVLQDVHPDDSSLDVVRAQGGGLRGVYADYVRAAFHPRFWDSDVLLDREQNVIGRGPAASLDEFTLMESNFTLFWGLSILLYEATLVSGDSRWDRVQRGEARFTPMERLGAELFDDDAECARCHQAPEFTNAAATNGGNGRAFANIGVRPTREDRGKEDGEFKSSSLRNIELTGPYFHNGGALTLRQVVDFYDRGGDFRRDSELDRLRLSSTEKDALVHFMLTLTDDRVRYRAAPFDGPSLNPPDGRLLPATGRVGGRPLRPFLDADPFMR